MGAAERELEDVADFGQLRSSVLFGDSSGGGR